MISLLLNLNANAASFNCHYGYKDKNNLIRYDVFASAYIEVNSFFKKLTFFGLKMEHMKTILSEICVLYDFYVICKQNIRYEMYNI